MRAAAVQPRMTSGFDASMRVTGIARSLLFRNSAHGLVISQPHHTLIRLLRAHHTFTRKSFGEMQTPHQTVFVQDLRNARFAERIAHGPPKPPNPAKCSGRIDAGPAPPDYSACAPRGMIP